ncbi:MAG: hypothetical protein FJ279_15670 [Planctomycetes bacterium]|nr:hypothetical protein [Planctomycetota bacterium]MBM4080074.1 hypothetical protein [Planctomycetota bacterium]
MDCTHARALMQEYLDGGLADEMASALNAHVATCRACRREMASYRVVFNVLDGQNLASAPVGITTRIMAAVTTSPRRREATWRDWALVAASVLVAAVFGVMALTSSAGQEAIEAATTLWQAADTLFERPEPVTLVDASSWAAAFGMLLLEALEGLASAFHDVCQIINPWLPVLTLLAVTLGMGVNVLCLTPVRIGTKAKAVLIC